MMRTMQEKISKDPLQILPDPGVDFTQLAKSINARVMNLAFRISALPMPLPRRCRPNHVCENGWAKVITARWIIWQSTVRGGGLVPGTLRVTSARMNYVPPARDSWEAIHDGNPRHRREQW